MNTLSAVMAVKNEESRIRRCLQHLKGFADEIVVVDMNSADHTLEICREFTDRIFVHDGGPLGLIPVNKQFGFQQATGDWIIIVDADFFFPGPCKESVRFAINSGGPEVAYTMTFKNLYFGKWPRYGETVHSYPLLFKRGCARYDGQTCHDMLKVDGPIGVIAEPFLHYGHPTIENFIANMNRYTSQDAMLVMNRNAFIPAPAVGHTITAAALIVKPIRRFLRLYLKKKGYRDGIHGLIVSGLLAAYLFIEMAKIYELEYKRRTQWTPDKGPDW